MSDTLHQKPFTETKKRSFAISVGLHIALFLVCFFMSLSSPQQAPTHRLIVQTVSLKQAPQQPLPLPEKKSLPIPLPEEPKEELQPEEPPPSVDKEVAQAPVPEDSHEEPPPAPQPVPKKESLTPSKKAAPKKPAPAPKKPTAKKPAQPSRKKDPPQKPAYDTKLLQEAMKRLNSSKTLSSKETAHRSNTAAVGTVGKLHSEEGVPSIRDEATAEIPPQNGAAASYVTDLVRRLQLHIRLPEPGEAKVKVTINKKGTVTSVEIVTCKSQAIRKAISEKLRHVAFSPFGNNFPGESEHSFMLRLSNDLIWSCS